MAKTVKKVISVVLALSFLLCVPLLAEGVAKSVKVILSPVIVKIDSKVISGDKLNYKGDIYVKIKDVALLTNKTYKTDKNGNISLESKVQAVKTPPSTTSGSGVTVSPTSTPKPTPTPVSDPLTLDRVDSNMWKLSAPEDQGLDSTVLNKTESVIANNYAAVSSFLVVRHGRLVYEKYFNNRGRDSAQHVFSVTKSFTSALTGIAMQKGFIKSVNQKLSEFYPEFMTSEADARVKDITIRQILSMTDGLESVGTHLDAWEHSSDWVKAAIDCRMLNDPGTKFIYNTGMAHIMGAIVSKTTGMSLRDFAVNNLFNPLGITNFQWQTDTSGRNGGGHLLYLTSRDMAKFGYLYLMNGKWNGVQVLPSEWIKETYTEKSDPGDGRKYGYFWWLEKKWDSVRNKNIEIYSANGYGGQYISVIPEYDMVVVITSEPYHPANKGDQTNNLIPECVFPAIK